MRDQRQWCLENERQEKWKKEVEDANGGSGTGLNIISTSKFLFFSYLNLFSQDIHKELEAKIARFHEREDAILYACCFDANTGLFETLLTPEDAVISDELNHASIIDGIRLCKAKKFKYKNKDMAGTAWQEKIEGFRWQ